MLAVLLLSIWFQNVDFQGWETLGKVKLVPGYDEFLGDEIEKPVFPKEISIFENTRVTVEGYVIPLGTSESSSYFVLSRFPFNSCFFCGNAGPETVIEVYTNEKFAYKDQKVMATGILRLNADDPLHLFFLLEEADVEIID
ncbi:MAG: hypothetical protein ACI9A7_000463 [Cyclobacteriaceae bacterium]|jgi:hypothetical protein